MFFDDYNKNKHTVNLGNKTLSSKDDFLKKIKEDERKEKEKIFIEQKKNIISSFIKKNFKSSSQFKEWKLHSKLNSIVALLQSKKFPANNNEQIAIKTIEKTINEINLYLNCRMNKENDLLSLLSSVYTILTYISPNSINIMFNANSNYFFSYAKMFSSLISIATVQMFKYIKRDYLLDDKIYLFSLLQMFLDYFPQFTKNVILNHLSWNISYLFLLSICLQNITKILNKQNEEIFLLFCEEIAYKLVKRREIKIKPNSKVSSFLKFYLKTLLEKNFDSRLLNNMKLTIFSLYFNLGDEEAKVQLLYKDSLLINLFNYIGFEISLNKKVTNCLLDESHVDSFILMFNQFQKSNLVNINRADFIKGLNDILDFFFKNSTNINIKKCILLLYHSFELIISLYKSSFEKINYQTILEHIVNKIALKYKPNLTQDVLLYSVELLKQVFPNLRNSQEVSNKIINTSNKIVLITNQNEIDKENEILFEIISFFVINQINYKSNYFFVEFKTTKNLYENLPFNYYYLNFLSKYLITLFTNIISQIDIEEIENLSQNMIIKCLKSLYLLDGEINYTPNREQFWNNMELVAKMTGNNSALLLEKMKIMPFIFPLKIRLNLGTKEISKIKEMNSNVMRNAMNPYRFQYDDMEIDDHDGGGSIIVPRDNIFEASFSFYLQNLLNPYNKWNITFVDKFGHKEDGVDAGGLYKEYMYKLSEEAFGAKIGLFKESATGFLLPNKEAYKISSKYLSMYEFLGFITAKAILDDIKLYPNISPIFYNNILEIENAFTDLKEYDSELYKNLTMLKTYEGDVENDFGLTFSITEEDSLSKKTRNINLIENGENIAVNNNNRLLYIKKMTEYKLTYQFNEECNAFKEGMQSVMSLETLKMFTGDELRQIVYGFDKDVFDVDDLKNNVKYVHFDLENEKDRELLNNFYQILYEFDDKEKEKFLFFCTSLKRLPIGGFKKMRPKFAIAKSDQGVPTSSTCVNMLKLPVLPYKKLKDMLRYVINADAGFYYA